MNPMEQLNRINERFQELLAAPEKAEFVPFHRSDDLMVWFLLGGKDVGKSTFLNALLGATVSGEPPEEAEGTRAFVAYIHESARPDFEERLDGLPIDVRFHVHHSEAHRRLCLIDSPDFDSRFERHASQVRQVLRAGIADGAVLLSSPAKYKDLKYWNAFEKLSGALARRHILFTLTKADELGSYLEDVRADFGRTIDRRMGAWQGDEGAGVSRPRDARIFLIDSLERAVDFSRLESRLLRKLSAGEVRDAQQENLRHTLTRGADRIRGHYRLHEVRRRLDEAAAADRTDDLFDEHFPGAYFDAVASRLAGQRELAAVIRDRLVDEAGRSLAGIPAILSAFRWVGSRTLFRLRAGGSRAPESTEAHDLTQLLRWGQEDLEQRIATAREEVLSGVRLGRPEAFRSYIQEAATLRDDLSQLLEDHLSGTTGNLFSWPMRLALNLPIYLYLLLFVTLLLYPVFLLLQAWDLLDAPRLTSILTLDNVKVSVIGFAGYYIMASLYVIRKYRERARTELESLSDRFTAAMREVVRVEMVRPLSGFVEAFDRLEESLNHCTGPGRPQRSE